jgi:hypothetical protein
MATMAIKRWAVLAALLPIAALAVPLVARAQASPKIPRIGAIGERSTADPFVALLGRADQAIQ